MAEKKFTYTAKTKQPQNVAGVMIEPKGGQLTERQYKAVQRDAYGATLLESGLLVVAEAPAKAEGEVIPNFDEGKNEGYEGKRDSPDQEHAGWTPPK